MHSQAAARMRQLVLHALEQMEVQESQLRIVPDVLRPLSDFVEKNFGQWLRGEFSMLYAHDAMAHVLSSSGKLPATGRLGDILDSEDKERIANEFCDVWGRLPIAYRFVFPLPLVGQFNDAFEVAPGVVIMDSPREMVDAEGMQLPRSLGGLAFLIPETPMASLVVEGEGLMQYSSSPTEVPAALAIRAAKVVIQLGIVEKIFNRAVFVSSQAPREARYTPPVGLSPTSGTVELPASFAAVLADVQLSQKTGGGRLPTQFSRIGAVLRHEADWNPDHPKPKDMQEIYERQIQQHCARIATAAEWLFDAEHQPESATTFVQTSIAFEALYGAGKGEPVVETLANRLAYALGKTPQHREHLRKWFVDFYNIRSTVVHSGASRLTGEQRNRLVFMQRAVLHDALEHELKLLENTKLSKTTGG